MPVNQIPLCHYVRSLSRAGLNPADIVPKSSLIGGGNSCRVMVQRGAPGNGVIGIPILGYGPEAHPVEIGMRKINEDGRVVDLYHNPRRAPLVFRHINPDWAKLAILGAFGPQELSNGTEGVEPRLLRRGVGILATWVVDEMDSMERELSSPGFQTMLSLAFFLNPIRTEEDLRDNNGILREIEAYETRFGALQSLMRRALVQMPFSLPPLEAFLQNP
jgi:hypothetical protein